MNVNQCLRIIFLILFSGAAQAQLPNYPKQKIHVYLLIGQSNMAGRGKIESEDTITHPRVWMLNKNNQWIPAKEPVQFDKPDVVGVGPALSFGKAMAEKNPNFIIALVPAAVGGSSIDVWKKGVMHIQTNRYPYDDAVKRALFAKDHGKLKGILWHQGESDCKAENISGYEIKLEEFVRTLKKDIKAKRIIMALGKMSDFLVLKNQYANNLNEAIDHVANDLNHIEVVSVTGLVDGGDRLHFDAASARELGMRYAKIFK